MKLVKMGNGIKIKDFHFAIGRGLGWVKWVKIGVGQVGEKKYNFI